MITNCIAKEDIPQYTFIREDVLRHDFAGQQSRRLSLLRAQQLGNGFQGKVRISFTTSEADSCQVETTVWQTSDEYVSLKGGIMLPVRAINRVEFA